jgi:hypothetical protein
VSGRGLAGAGSDGPRALMARAAQVVNAAGPFVEAAWDRDRYAGAFADSLRETWGEASVIVGADSVVSGLGVRPPGAGDLGALAGDSGVLLDHLLEMQSDLGGGGESPRRKVVRVKEALRASNISGIECLAALEALRGLLVGARLPNWDVEMTQLCELAGSLLHVAPRAASMVAPMDVVVDGGSPGGCATIQAAVDLVEDYGVVRIAAGRWPGGVHISRPMTIVGDRGSGSAVETGPWCVDAQVTMIGLRIRVCQGKTGRGGPSMGGCRAL